MIKVVTINLRVKQSLAGLFLAAVLLFGLATPAWAATASPDYSCGSYGGNDYSNCDAAASTTNNSNSSTDNSTGSVSNSPASTQPQTSPPLNDSNSNNTQPVANSRAISKEAPRASNKRLFIISLIIFIVGLILFIFLLKRRAKKEPKPGVR